MKRRPSDAPASSASDAPSRTALTCVPLPAAALLPVPSAHTVYSCCAPSSSGGAGREPRWARPSPSGRAMAACGCALPCPAVVLAVVALVCEFCACEELAARGTMPPPARVFGTRVAACQARPVVSSRSHLAVNAELEAAGEPPVYTRKKLGTWMSNFVVRIQGRVRQTGG